MKQTKKGDSKIVAHARRELEMAKLFEVRPDYDGSIGRGVLALVKEFDKWCEDDTAKMQALHSCFNYLVVGDILSRPTDDPAEWENWTGPDDMIIVRNIRNNFYITDDGMKTWKNIRTQETGNCVNHITGKVPKEKSDGPGRNIDAAIVEGKKNDGIPSEPTEMESRKLDLGLEPKGEEKKISSKTTKKKS